MNGASTSTVGRPRPADLFAVLREGPAGTLARAVCFGLAALAVARLHAVHDPGVLCPLRRLTGVPCPLCGSTTVFIELGGGNLRQAFLANPVTLVAAAGLVVAPLGPGRWWWRSPEAIRVWLLCGVLALSWMYQLSRFDLLPY